jgi:hypothetical protein
VGGTYFKHHLTNSMHLAHGQQQQQQQQQEELDE